ncbi:hypothetical protein [Streptomyces sp. NPDC127072]|uniref:hypothetical protein n=1 Tax=Streptomyces sp. NPDC127072 TaxID=3347129 RepID=UPI0036479732
MTPVRRALPEDAEEVLRLRQVMIDSVFATEPSSSAWHAESLPTVRRGYARAGMETLLGWFRERGVTAVDLSASAEAEPLYASLGFVRKPDPSMRLRL